MNIRRILWGCLGYEPPPPEEEKYIRLNCIDGRVDYGPLFGHAPIPFPPKPAPLQFPTIDASLLPAPKETA